MDSFGKIECSPHWFARARLYITRSELRIRGTDRMGLIDVMNLPSNFRCIHYTRLDIRTKSPDSDFIDTILSLKLNYAK